MSHRIQEENDVLDVQERLILLLGSDNSCTEGLLSSNRALPSLKIEMGPLCMESSEMAQDHRHRIYFNEVDKLQTPVAHERKNLVEGFQGKTPALMCGMRFEIEDQAYISIMSQF